jgi:hypothetical protein
MEGGSETSRQQAIRQEFTSDFLKSEAKETKKPAIAEGESD